MEGGSSRTSRKRVVAGLGLIVVLSLVMASLWVSRANANGATAALSDATSTLPPTTVPPTTVPPTTVPPTTVPPTTVPPTTVPPPPPPPASNVLPARGEATAFGCGPALQYMRAYADPTFELVCPGDAQGHQATTCFGESPCAPGQRMIEIADPCPAAYMNEAHNSWVLDHEATGSPIPDGSSAIDPYGYCHS